MFLLKIVCSLWLGGKCLSIRHRKLRAMFVLTFLLNGGLNQMREYLFGAGSGSRVEGAGRG